LPDELEILTVLNDSRKQFFSAVTRVTRALDVYYGNALYKSTFYLLNFFSLSLVLLATASSSHGYASGIGRLVLKNSQQWL